MNEKLEIEPEVLACLPIWAQAAYKKLKETGAPTKEKNK